MEYYWSIKGKTVRIHTITWVNVTYINKEASPQASCGFINMQCLGWVTGSRLGILGKGMWVGVDKRNGCLLGKLSFWWWKNNVLKLDGKDRHRTLEIHTKVPRCSLYRGTCGVNYFLTKLCLKRCWQAIQYNTSQAWWLRPVIPAT